MLRIMVNIFNIYTKDKLPGIRVVGGNLFLGTRSSEINLLFIDPSGDMKNICVFGRLEESDSSFMPAAIFNAFARIGILCVGGVGCVLMLGSNKSLFSCLCFSEIPLHCSCNCSIVLSIPFSDKTRSEMSF